MLFFLSKPSMDPHFLQNKVQEENTFSLLPYLKPTVQPPFLAAPRSRPKPLPFKFEFCSPPSLCLESHCPACVWHLCIFLSKLLWISKSESIPSPQRLGPHFYYITHRGSPHCNWVTSPSPDWGVFRGNDSFVSSFMWLLAQRGHSNICSTIIFQWLFSKWANHHPAMNILGNYDLLILGFLRRFPACPHSIS